MCSLFPVIIEKGPPASQTRNIHLRCDPAAVEELSAVLSKDGECFSVTELLSAVVNAHQHACYSGQDHLWRDTNRSIMIILQLLFWGREHKRNSARLKKKKSCGPLPSKSEEEILSFTISVTDCALSTVTKFCIATCRHTYFFKPQFYIMSMIIN